MTNKALISRLIAATARILPLRFVPLDALLLLAQKATSMVARAVYVRDWQLEARGRPQFFKHRINLSAWPSDPARWSFVARGVYARQGMFRGCKVLDLCCGDGSTSYLFFSDIAGCIDALDNDAYAIAYACNYFASPVVSYRKVDIVSERFPSDQYDFVVWNAAICYFRANEIDRILEKIVMAGKPSMRMSGMLPRANGWIDHKTEFADRGAVESLLSRFFASVTVLEIDEGAAVTFYFQAAAPLTGSTRHGVL